MPGQYEFQCLHGMGEPLYTQIVGARGLHRPCRVYAPVGSHDTLLAYLVRRLLENGANTSFVNRIADPNVPVEALIEDPVAATRALDPIGAPHPRIAHAPRSVRSPSAPIPAGSISATKRGWPSSAQALVASAAPRAAAADGTRVRILRNPADQRDIVGSIRRRGRDRGRRGLRGGGLAAGRHGAISRPPSARAILARAAALFEAQRAAPRRR